MTTMRFADEVRPLDDIEAATQKSHKPTKKQLDAAVAVIEELSTEWKPEKYTDCHRERLQDVVNRKRKGQTIKAPKQEKAPDTPPDLMEALERTLAEIGGSA